MELHVLTGKLEVNPKAAVRILADTNVAAPALRWLALGSATPQPDIVNALTWMQGCALSARFRPQDLRLDLQWAAVETSRNHGRIDGERLARMHAANVVLLDWLWSVVPIASRFDTEPPRLRPIRQVRTAAHRTPDNTIIVAESICLIELSRLHRLRQAGELVGVTQRLRALEEWSETIKPLGAVSADVILIAIQTALGGDGAPARAMCKFGQYVDRSTARSKAANAAWDLQFLRLMRCSEAGLPPYTDYFGPTTLLTFDRHLAAAAGDLVYKARVDGPAGSGSTVGTVMSNRKHLQNDVLRNPLMLDRLDQWCRELAALQLARWDRPRAMSAEAIEAMLDETLESTFSA